MRRASPQETFIFVKSLFKTVFPVLTAAAYLCGSLGSAAEWQWSVPISSVTSSETNAAPRAFLWIPPGCRQVRAVVVGQHNMEEEPIFEHPKFRAALAELGFAVVWVTPGWDLFFRFDLGAGEKFQEMMTALAAESGYAELATAPIVPLGHSAAASYPWNFAAWAPDRTLAVISVSGQWPYYADQNTPDWAGRTVDGVPGLVSMGEYEAAEERAGTGLQQRSDHPKTALSMLANPGAGHFDVSDEKVEYLAFYLRKAAQYRLPGTSPAGTSPVKLTPIDPTTGGWLADRWHKDGKPSAPAAPVGRYKGDPKNAFWYFDEEHAQMTEQFQARDRGKKQQLVGYVQDGQVVEQNPKAHAQVLLKFVPLEDGISFRLTGTFLDTVPEGRPEKWTGLPKDAPVPHAAAGGPVVISRICGPVEQTGPDTWAIRFYRMGMDNTKRSNDIWLLASHPGDAEFRRAVQQSQLRFPLKNTAGADQKITFPKIPDQRAGAQTVKLHATSDSGEPVHYYIREGPAELDRDTLHLTAIPPRAKFPVKVTVIAWQWGRSLDPKLKTAEPVEQTFSIVP